MTFTEKLIIIAIVGLLFFGLTLGPAKAQDIEVIEDREEQIDFMDTSIIMGVQLDPTPYLTWIQTATLSMDPRMLQHLGLTFAHCHIMWQNGIDEELYSELNTKELYQAYSDRALHATKMFVYLSGGDPSRVEEFLIPGLFNAGVVVDAGTVSQCTVLNTAATMLFDGAETPETPESAPKNHEFNS